MQLLNTFNSAFTWRRAKKIRGLRAKPLINLIVDRTVVNKFLIDTLEGKEPIDSVNMFCIGAGGDAWQQTAQALLRKYDIKNIDPEGWMICEPKPENEVQFIQLDEQFIRAHTDFRNGEGFIEGLWGATIDGVENLQAFVKGDFICRQTHDTRDQWIVRQTLFINTYEVLGEK